MWQEIACLILLHILSLALSTKSDCTISINGDLTISKGQPLLLNPEGGSGINGFYLPDSRGIITFSDNQLIDLVCPNGKIVLNDTVTTSATAKVSCIDGSFVINQRNIFFSNITCTIHADHTAKYTGKTCAFNYSEVEVGFPVPDRFLRLFTICFDRGLQNALYAENVITKAIAGHQIYPRTSWLQGKYLFTISSVDRLYDRDRQRTIINGLLGLSLSSYKYIHRSSDYYLARGHLTPKTDFIYGSQQRATFYLINAVPQWQIFNAMNWFTLEKNIRSFAARKGLDLTVYTGTYGITTLPHETNGQDIELYLYVEGNTKRIPVPRLIWKALYEPTTKAGVVFILVNNPYFSSPKDIICTDICSQYSWLTWKASNRTLGYGYCCSVPDFRRTVRTFPNIQVSKLLN